MIDVDPLFTGKGFKTEVWVSEQVAKGLRAAKRSGRRPPTVAKLRRYAERGFQNFEPDPIKLEWDGVYRIADDMLRLIGFYQGNKTTFIIVDWFKKSGQKLSAAERSRIDAVAEVKKSGSWRKRKT